MTYIIAEPCIEIKKTARVWDVCQVDCIHEFERILISQQCRGGGLK